MSRLRVVHYLNQFFAGMGSEEKADVPPGRKAGAVGPGIALQQALGEWGQVLSTVYCGDNYVAEREGAVDEIVDLIAQEEPALVVAGPAFAAGRYGLACGEVCVRARERLGVVVVTGMHAENPGADLYRSRVYIAKTRETAAGMVEAVKTMARLALKLQAGEPLGPPQEEGYVPTGRRVHFIAEKTAAKRAVEMVLRKVHGKPFATEWPVPTFSRVPPAPPIADVSKAKVAVITAGALVPKGNPDRLESAFPDRWLKYSVAGLDDLHGDRWQSAHGGFNTTSVNEDPDRLVPLDALRALEREGVLGEIHDQVYTFAGTQSTIPNMRRFGQEIARELKAASVDGVVLTST